MDRILPGESLPGSLSLPDKRISQSSHGIVDSSDPGIVCDIRSAKFCERTSGTAHRRGIESMALRTPDVNRDHARELGGLMNLTHYPRNLREIVKKFDMEQSTDSWTKVRDLRLTLIQYLL